VLHAPMNMDLAHPCIMATATRKIIGHRIQRGQTAKGNEPRHATWIFQQLVLISLLFS
jgi:hypothetical protein